MKDHWENDEKMMRENTREPVVSFLILPGVVASQVNSNHVRFPRRTRMLNTIFQCDALPMMERLALLRTDILQSC